MPDDNGRTARESLVEIKRKDPTWETPILDNEVKIPKVFKPIFHTFLELRIDRGDMSPINNRNLLDWAALHKYQLQVYQIELIRFTDKVFLHEWELVLQQRGTK